MSINRQMPGFNPDHGVFIDKGKMRAHMSTSDPGMGRIDTMLIFEGAG
jgi:hypothetical protein